jgi:hypothetical protein
LEFGRIIQKDWCCFHWLVLMIICSLNVVVKNKSINSVVLSFGSNSGGLNECSS